VLNEKVSRLTLDPAFRLDADAPSAAFPVDAGIDLTALSPTATSAGRFAIRAATPVADAMALLATLVITANAHWIGLSFALLTLAGLAATGKHDARIDLRVLKDAPAIAARCVPAIGYRACAGWPKSAVSACLPSSRRTCGSRMPV